MTQRTPRNGWILRTKQVTVTSWKFRFLVLFGIFLLLYFAYPAWLVTIGRELVHDEDLQPADLLLVENFDTDYSVFEAAQELLRSGFASQVLIPVVSSEKNEKLTSVEQGFVEVMSRAAGIEEYEILPVKHVEPISLNVARQVAERLEAKGIQSVIVVSPQLRSARSYLIYDHVFTERGIRVQGFAARSTMPVDHWWNTWHGMQDVGLEFSKLLYYRLWVL